MATNECVVTEDLYTKEEYRLNFDNNMIQLFESCNIIETCKKIAPRIGESLKQRKEEEKRLGQSRHGSTFVSFACVGTDEWFINQDSKVVNGKEVGINSAKLNNTKLVTKFKRLAEIILIILTKSIISKNSRSIPLDCENPFGWTKTDG